MSEEIQVLPPLALAFMTRLYDSWPLRLADRPEDRARQWCRRMGYVEYVGKPKKWKLTPVGEAITRAAQTRV